MIGPVRDRATFAAFGRSHRRVRRGGLTLTFVPGAADEPTRVAYAIGRRVGGDVRRNRLRRQLRAVMAGSTAQMRPGAYLVGAGRPTTGVPYQELKAMVSSALHELNAPTSPVGRP